MKQVIVKIVIKFGTEILVIVVLGTPLLEKNPPPHVVEADYPTQPIPELVMSYSGSLSPGGLLPVSGSTDQQYFEYTGSLVRNF